jgi:hypothetical protein
LQAKLEEALGGSAGFARFTDQVLETSEAAMIQVHNLRNLAKRFPPDVEQRFDRNGLATLAQLRSEYIDALSAKAAVLQRLMDPVLVSLGAVVTDTPAAPPPPAHWQAATDTLFAEAQRSDQLLTSLLAGTGIERSAGVITEANRSLRQLRADIGWYQALIGGEKKRR